MPQFNIWKVQESENLDLLEAAIDPSLFSQMVICIMLDLEQPWLLMEQLRKWFKALQAWIFKVLPNLEPGVYEKMKNKLIHQWKTFEAPDFDEHGNLKNPIKKEDEGQAPKKNTGTNSESEEEIDQQQLELDAKYEMPLPDGCLKVNLGIPIMIVVNKSDLLLHGDNKALLEENFDFIQKNVREYALQYGATIVFTSANAKRNLDVWY